MLQIREGQSKNKLSNHNNYLWNRVELLYQGAVVKVSLLSKPPTQKKCPQQHSIDTSASRICIIDHLFDC